VCNSSRGVAKDVLGKPVPTTENGAPIAPGVVPSAMVLNNKIIFAILSVCWLQLGLTKLSILFFYRRIFCTEKTNILNYSTIFMIAITILWSIAFFFANLLECGTTFSADWDDNDEQAISSCVNEWELSQGQFYSDFIIDVILFVMPLPTIWKLNMPLQRRIGVLLILAVGALTVVASTIKVAIITGLALDVSNDFIAPDPMILNSILIFWTLLESGIAQIVISLPTLRRYADKSPDLLRSLRSIISLQSLGSAARSRETIRLPDEQSNTSEPGIAKIDRLEQGMGDDAHVMKVMPSDNSSTSKSGTMVESHVTREFDGRQAYQNPEMRDV